MVISQRLATIQNTIIFMTIIANSNSKRPQLRKEFAVRPGCSPPPSSVSHWLLLHFIQLSSQGTEHFCAKPPAFTCDTGPCRNESLDPLRFWAMQPLHLQSTCREGEKLHMKTG